MEQPTAEPPSRARRARRWALPAAVIAAVAVSLAAGTYFFTKARRAYRPPTYVDLPLGVRRVPGVEESGFHDTEGGTSAEAFRWTDGAARLTVPLDGRPPVALHVRLGLGVPKPTTLTIRVNGTAVFNETVKPQTDWARTFDLSGLVLTGPATVEVLSDTFTPTVAATKPPDARSLGVIVRGVTLVSGSQELAGVNFAAGPVVGVEESGFYHREEYGGQPCRWTDGAAKVVVPAPRDRRWKALAVTAVIPDRPNHRVRVLVNGTTVFDGVPKPGESWEAVLPLDGVELGGLATIELLSSTAVPDPSGSKDTRALGVRLRKLTLIAP